MTLTVDHCLDIGLDPKLVGDTPNSSDTLPGHLCRGAVRVPLGLGPLGWGNPFVLGGKQDDAAFTGCISHIMINKEVCAWINKEQFDLFIPEYFSLPYTVT